MEDKDLPQRRLEAALDYLKSEQGAQPSDVTGDTTSLDVAGEVADYSHQSAMATAPEQPEYFDDKFDEYSDQPAGTFNENDQIPAFLHEPRFQPEISSGRSVTGVLVAISGLAAFTVFGAIVLYKSQVLDLSFLNPDFVEESVAEARVIAKPDTGNIKAAEVQTGDNTMVVQGKPVVVPHDETTGDAKVAVVSEPKKAWQEKLTPPQSGDGTPVELSATETAKISSSENGVVSAGVSTFGSVPETSSARSISTKAEDLPIDEIPLEGADATINQLESSIGISAKVPETNGNQSSDVKVLAQASSAKENVDPKLKALTDQVVEALSDLGGENGNAAVPLTDSVNRLRSSLANLVQEAESQGRSQENVELLIKEAIGGSSKNLPAALKNKDGSLDITSLLTSVVNGAKKVNSGSSADSAYLSAIEQEGNGTAVTTNKASARYVIVKAGDSLSSISFAAYGDALEYPKIYQANRSVIQNPNVLLIGTKLMIP